MISREHRFHGFTSLRHVYRNGQVVRGQLFSVKFVLNPRRSSFRAAVVVSRKVHKSAVTRNRIRRRLYEIIRLIQDNIRQPFDIVITVYSEAVADEPAKSLELILKKQFQEAGIISRTTAPREEN